jgi:hypothetical protein
MIILFPYPIIIGFTGMAGFFRGRGIPMEGGGYRLRILRDGQEFVGEFLYGIKQGLRLGLDMLVEGNQDGVGVIGVYLAVDSAWGFG